MRNVRKSVGPETTKKNGGFVREKDGNLVIVIIMYPIFVLKSIFSVNMSSFLVQYSASQCSALS